MGKKIHSYAIIGLFLILISIPLIFSNKRGGEISVEENRYLATFPQIITPDKNFAPGIPKGLENWIKDNAGFRLNDKKVLATIDYRVFGVSPSPLVHVGEDGWFYYTGENDLEIAQGTFSLDEATLKSIARNETKIQTALRKKGIEYVIVFSPSKGSIYPEYIKGGGFQVRKTVIDVTTDYLREHTTIPIINLKDDLLAAKKSEIIYFKTDTHWNEIGAYIGYSSLVNHLNDLGMIATKPAEIERVPSTRNGEFAAMMGDPNLLDPEPFDHTKIITPKAVGIFNGEYYEKMQGLMEEDNVNLGYYSFLNSSVSGKRALVYGDSFFALWNIPELLAENFSSLDLIRSDAIRNNVIEQTKPDIVILERTERGIFTLASPQDAILINYPLTNPATTILSDDTPAQMSLGQKYTLHVTVNNNGAESWSEDQQIRLCLFVNGNDSGYRFKLPNGVEVQPGEAYTFELKDWQLPSADIATIEYQMMQEGFMWFGDKKQVSVTIVK